MRRNPHWPADLTRGQSPAYYWKKYTEYLRAGRDADAAVALNAQIAAGDTLAMRRQVKAEEAAYGRVMHRGRWNPSASASSRTNRRRRAWCNPDPVARYASVLRLLAGATTPGERVAADAARQRMEGRYPGIRSALSAPRPSAPQPSTPPRPPPTPWGSTVRVEYVDGSSSKFWEYVEMSDGMTVRIRWGRIGSDGRSQIVALTVAENRLWEKLKKGYRRV